MSFCRSHSRSSAYDRPLCDVQYASSSFHAAKAQAASASISFTGTGVWFFGAKLPTYGTYSIAVDGQTVQQGSAQSDTAEFKAALGGVSGLSNGKHTAVLTSTNGVGLDLDSVIFESQIGATRYVV
jgi:hypothetical protein